VNLTYFPPLANHLWQSTVFAGIAGLLTLALLKNRARVRYWVWLAASCKFLLPLSLLMALGADIQWRTAPEIGQSKLAVGVSEVNEPFAPLPATSQGDATPAPASSLPAVLLVIWACGFLGISAAWWARWRRFRTTISRGTPMQLALPLPVMCATTLTEPGVFGIFRPVLMLPDGIFERLTSAQLEAVIAHELCHVRHRDNLFAAIHMFVETVFWFHPLVWWIGKRMVDERELGCDEEVLQLGSQPLIYAEGILGVCKLYVDSPLTCVSGVSGANLKKRIEAIMKNRAALRLDFTRKAMLAVCGAAALALPFAMGIVNAPFVRAQSSADQKRITFDAASVKAASLPEGVQITERGGMVTRKGSGVSVPQNTGGPGTDDPGRIHYPYITLRALLRRAWDLSYEFDGPGWLDEQAVAVDATMPPDTTKAQFQEMLRNLITERFGLQYHAQRKEIMGYALVIGKNGPKLKVSADQGEAEPARVGRPTGTGADGFPIFPPFQGKRLMLVTNRIRGRFRIIAQQVTIKELPRMLSRELGPHVTDATGLTAKYDFTLTYQTNEPEPPPGNPPEALEPAPDIFAAMQSQLRLKLERKAVPVEVIVIDHIEKTPKEN
jgi:bla regulator protein BlaR1